MIMVGIVVDEKFPVYRLGEVGEQSDALTSINVDTLRRWKAACEVYEQIQKEMEVAYRAVVGPVSD